MHFNLPRRTLNAFTDHNELHRIGDLQSTPGIADYVMLQLARFALPWLGDERRVCSLMFDHFVWMVLQPYRSLVCSGTAYEGPPSRWARAMEKAV